MRWTSFVLLAAFALESTELTRTAWAAPRVAVAPETVAASPTAGWPRPTPVPAPAPGRMPAAHFFATGTEVEATFGLGQAGPPASGSSTFEHTYPAGWSLASVPLVPDNPAPPAVFDGIPAPLRLYDYVQGHVLAPGEPGARNVAPGRAYWLLLQNPTSVRVAGQLVATGAVYRIPLQPGWNAIATPWLFATEWTDAQVSVRNGSTTLPLEAAAAATWIDPALEEPASGGGYQSIPPNSSPGGRLLPWRGYELFSRISGELILASPPPDSTPPTASFTGLADGATITAPVEISGAVGDENLIEWRLEYVPAEGGVPVVLGQGGAPVTGSLGTFDPTMLLNGVYQVRLIAVDAAGTTTAVTRSVVVKGDQKVGNFSVSFLDLELPLAGLPIRVMRTYDSRDKRRGDFGVGWRIDVSNLRVVESGILGLGWEGTVSGGFFPLYCNRPVGAHIVSITFPDNSVYEFEPVTNPECQQIIPPGPLVSVGFRPRGTQAAGATLEPLDAPGVVAGPWPGTFTLLDDSTFEPWDPDLYRLTMPDGRAFVIHQQQGLQSITDLSGNQLTMGPGGIVHSSGRGIAFTRDGLGRITAITDPAGNAMTYTYDASGDLVAFTDRENDATTFTYNTTHGLLTIEDSRGIQPIRNEYDESGRLLRHTDAFGKTIEYTHDVAGRQEIVTDRLGRVRVFEYNERGKVVREIDPDGHATTRTFDTRGNRTTETDPLGNTTTYAFDAQDNVLSVTDPMGNVVARTYDARKQILTTTDARGKVSTNTFDAAGNLASNTDADGKVRTFTSDGSGNVLTATDPLSGVSQFTYDSFGNLTKERDALGHETTFTYDANGNRLTQTKTRTVGGASETLTWTFAYDKAGRIVQTTDAEGAVTRTTYDAVGKRSTTVDRKGRTTSFEYDDLSRLTKTTFPDGTAEENTYDAEGRRITGKDRAGRVTTYEYDALGRLLKTTHPDGSFTTDTYDAAGRVVATRDARGNVTAKEYDAASRLIKETDALGKVTTFTWDKAGNLLTVKDARGHTTTHEYDALNRRTRTLFADGSDKRTAYDALGRVAAETDQAGRTTQFTYDALGRMTRVTDALGKVTLYAYDELGNRLSQTDANGHVTSFEYDKAGRPTQRTLPGGNFEAMTYDEAGNLATRTDFNNKTMTYAYELNDRLVTRSYPDGTSVRFTYTPTGQRATALDSRGTTTYAYDVRNRLATLTYPDGRKLAYAYDGQSNRTSLTATIGLSNLTTTYSYDAVNRLSTVSDPMGRSYVHQYDANGNRASLAYPNGVTTTYTYNPLNRLTNLGTVGPLGTVQSYAYALAPAGQRTQVTEADGTSHAYTYDALYRLTRETVAGAAPYDKAFTHDPVGNRITQATTGGGAGAVNYAYDDRDRLLTENLTGYSYDVNGNLLSKSGEGTFVWDFDNRLRRVVKTDGTVVEHAYDADGNRVQTRTTPAGGIAVVANYLVDPASSLSQVVAESDAAGGVTAYYVRGDDLLAAIRSTGTRFYHADGLASIRRLTDEAGNVTDAYSFTAFGELLTHTGSDPNAYLFAGQPLDPNSGFYYNRARWMDPRTGRFVSLDTHPGVATDPASLHKYLYAAADPVNNVDPSGLFSIGSMVMTSAIVGCLAGALTGYIAGGWKGALAGAVSGLILSPLIALGTIGAGYFIAAAAGVSVATGLAVSGGTAMALFGLLGIRDLMTATTPREQAAAAVGLAIMIASLGTARAMAPRNVTVLGSRADCAPLKNVPGFDVLSVPNSVWSEGLNAGWLQGGIDRGNVIMLRTNPQAFAALMKARGTSSVFLNLELPMLQSQGFIEVGPFMVRW
jgi:RHS repeat-associated protein